MQQYPPVKSTIMAIATLYWVRMIGLFMALPVLSIYAAQYDMATPLLVATALGVYGLTQGALQIPMGMLSDRIGRLPVLYIGFALFTLGSLIAALSTSIWGLVIGRALQGSGAVAGVLMALLADTTSEKVRGAAMAGVGASIGLAFAVAMVLAPWLASSMGVSAIFWAATFGGLASIVVLALWVAKPVQNNQPVQPALFGELLRTPKLIVGYSGVFVVHLLLMALFVVVPGRLIEQTSLSVQSHSWVYLAAMFAGFVGMVPLMIQAERRNRPALSFVLAAIALSASIVWASQATGFGLVSAIVLFFVGFNGLEALLPSFVSKAAPGNAKGTVMSIYSTSQFIGTFIGAMLGGLIASDIASVWFIGAVAVLPIMWAMGAVGLMTKVAVTNTAITEN